MKEHERGGPSLHDIVTAIDGGEVLLPTEAAEDRRRDGAIEAGGRGEEITVLTQLAYSVFSPGNRGHRPVDFYQVRGERLIDGGGEFVAVDALRKGLAVHEIANDFAFGGSAPLPDLLRGGVDAVVSQCAA